MDVNNSNINDVKDRIDKMFDILVTAQESLKIVECLLEYNTPQEKFFKKKNYFLIWSMIVNWRIVVIELTKLLSEGKNHHFGLTELFNEVKRNVEFVTLIQEPDIIKYNNQIDSKKSIVDKLKLQRNKVYAHSDKNGDSIRNDVSVKEAQELIDLIQNVLNSICVRLGLPPYEFFLLGEPVDGLKQVVTALIDRDNFLKVLEEGGN